MSRHRRCPGCLRAPQRRWWCGVTLAAVTDICHLSPHCPRGQGCGCVDNGFIDSSSPWKWRLGNMSSAFINSLSQQLRRAALAYNTYSCRCLPSTASPALLHIFQPFLQTACQAAHFRRESHTASYVFTARPPQQHQQVSRSSLPLIVCMSQKEVNDWRRKMAMRKMEAKPKH